MTKDKISTYTDTNNKKTLTRAIKGRNYFISSFTLSLSQKDGAYIKTSSLV